MALNLDARQRAMLEAMGITVWLPESAETATDTAVAVEAPRMAAMEAVPTAPVAPATRPLLRPFRRPSQLPRLRFRLLLPQHPLRPPRPRWLRRGQPPFFPATVASRIALCSNQPLALRASRVWAGPSAPLSWSIRTRPSMCNLRSKAAG